MRQTDFASQEVAMLPPKTRDKIEQAKIAIFHERWDEATALVQSAAVDAPDSDYVMEHLAYAFLCGEKLASAERAAEEVLTKKKESWMAHYVLGEVHYRNGDLPSAICAFRAANKVCPNDSVILSEILLGLGLGLFHIGKYAEAIGVLERANNLSGEKGNGITFALAECLGIYAAISGNPNTMERGVRFLGECKGSGLISPEDMMAEIASWQD